MQKYESIFILDSLLAPEEIDKLVNRIKEIVESNGGKILTVDKWGKRRLAYEIQKKQYGFYVAVEFEGEGPIPNSLEHEYNFNDKILRYLTYRYTKNKIIAREKELAIGKSQPVTAEITEVAPKVEEKDKEVLKTEQPETEKPETEKPETEKPETEKPETIKPETDIPETVEPATEEPEEQEPEEKEAENA
jgi:small subunit ribosomal protein S6